MRIDLDELIGCEKCGVIFNYTLQKEDSGFDYINYSGKCPVCKEEFLVCD